MAGRIARWVSVLLSRLSDSEDQVVLQRAQATGTELSPILDTTTTVSATAPVAGFDTGDVAVARAATPRQHVVVWLVGVLLASLIPFLFQYLHGVDRGNPPGIFSLLGHGDLLLISLVVTIAGITELVLVVHSLTQKQIMIIALVLLGALLVIAAEALWYADIASQLLDGQLLITSAPVITYGSISLFVLSAFCSTVSVWLAAGTR
jgi:hypothetical protein